MRTLKHPDDKATTAQVIARRLAELEGGRGSGGGRPFRVAELRRLARELGLEQRVTRELAALQEG